MKNITKVAKLNKNIAYYELKGENYIDSKNYSYDYTVINNIEEAKRKIGNIYDYMPTVNNGQIEYNELRIFNSNMKVIFKFYNKNNVKVIAKVGNKQHELELDLATLINQNLVEAMTNMALENA